MSFLIQRSINQLKVLRQFSRNQDKSNLFHDDFTSKPENKLTGFRQTKFQIFTNEEATEILDIDEERQKTESQTLTELHESIYQNLNLQRGLAGVFEIEDLVDVLKKDNASDIFVCSVPKEIKYVDYMCICTGNSYRHMSGLAHFVRKVFKLKRQSGDILPKIEGEKCKDWLAMDLGNIALHIFSKNAREKYELESLWSLGSEFDNQYNQKDPMTDLFEKHALYSVAQEKL